MPSAIPTNLANDLLDTIACNQIPEVRERDQVPRKNSLVLRGPILSPAVVVTIRALVAWQMSLYKSPAYRRLSTTAAGPEG